MLPWQQPQQISPTNGLSESIRRILAERAVDSGKQDVYRAEVAAAVRVNPNPVFRTANDPYSHPSSEETRGVRTVAEGLSFISNRVWLAQLATRLVSSGGVVDYYTRYNTNNLTVNLRKKGYVLLMTDRLVEDMNYFMSKNSQTTLSVLDIRALCRSFDVIFSPNELFRWIEQFVEIEFIGGKKDHQRFSSRLNLSSGQGGMLGGYLNRMYGLGQFSPATYRATYAFARSVGLKVPAVRTEQTFAQMLVMIYCLAILNQPFLIARQMPITIGGLYAVHNQGTAYLATKIIPRELWDSQSDLAISFLKSAGFKRA